ncbi:sensor histidine kinase [Spongiivirga citrea]|uniref:Signal transduction histidine kinase internal region domain-containing protein n=1 Tax=Spongiivirga citrea TaxID=1481457 RepID=A0A6M0CG61_9FLAO|nr:histidine kinase [Spongiivirga citrea]NER15873.1 hypothetical protein [Spongiivirga citrea]
MSFIQFLEKSVEGTNSYAPLSGIQDPDWPLGFFAWVQGMLLVMFLYHFFIYGQNKSRTFLFYSLYILALTIYFLFESPAIFLEPIRIPFIPVIYHQIHLLAYVFYISFIRELAETRITVPKWDKVLKFLVYFLLFYIVFIAVIGYFIGPSLLSTLASVALTILSIASITNAVILFKIKSPYIYFFILGTICYVIGANLALYASYTVPSEQIQNHLALSPSVYVQVGAVMEILFFALSIGSRIASIERDKNLSEIALLQKTLEASELKMTALRAQMNPHFVFNALNSVRSYIIKNDAEKASDYLAKFSKLIRRILKNSNKNSISLSEELETIKTYVQLEAIRIKGGFNFNLDLDENIVPEDIEVPALFLQPYIENAIWHGLSHKDGEKKLDLTIRQVDNNIELSLTDNGIGIMASSELNKNLGKTSVGTKITSDRIQSFYDDNASIQIRERDYDLEEEKGTEVKIILPINK